MKRNHPPGNPTTATAAEEPEPVLNAGGTERQAPSRNRLSPKKLLRSKWTAVQPVARQKHFLVTHVVLPDLPGAAIEWVDLEAVHSGAVTRMAWRELQDPARWRQGWV